MLRGGPIPLVHPLDPPLCPVGVTSLYRVLNYRALNK